MARESDLDHLAKHYLAPARHGRRHYLATGPVVTFGQ